VSAIRKPDRGDGSEWTRENTNRAKILKIQMLSGVVEESQKDAGLSPAL
jgi:hypothetical protein